MVQGKEELSFERDGNAYFIKFKEPQKVGSNNNVVVFYEGEPQVSVRPLWSGGVT